MLEGPFAGGMGIVYQAMERTTGDVYALKSFKTEFVHDQEALAGFRKELHQWFELPPHANVVSAFRGFMDDLRPWLVLEWAGEGNLRSYVGANPHAVSLAMLVQHVCAGVQHIHAHGMVHGDLKPENVLIGGGLAKVTDLGIARPLGTAIAGGTPRYFAPELATTGLTSFAGDVYAFGEMLAELLELLPEDPVRDALAVVATECKATAPEARIASFSAIRERCAEIAVDAGASRYVETVAKRTTEMRDLIRHVEPELEEIDRGSSLLTAGMLEDALVVADHVLARNPESWRAVSLRAKILDAAERYGEAADAWKRMFELRPDEPGIVLNQAASLLWAGRRAEARELAESVTSHPAHRHDLFGLIAEDEKRWDVALEEFRKALGYEYTSRARLLEAKALFKLERNEEAYAIAREVADAHDDEHLAALGWLAQICIELDRFAEAGQYLQTFLELPVPAGQRAWALRYLGLVHSRRQLWDEARDALDEALQLDPDHPDALLFGGQAYRRLGKWKRAADLFERLASVRGEAEDLFAAGSAAAEANRVTKAIDFLERCLALDPDHYDAGKLVSILKEMKR
ncbi:MAG TPA: tetratricopeptide repeat protein [Kofleriaceae bacterium]|nr:tetratricopeptide repeat protein [Kofleriaceae bacterium]